MNITKGQKKKRRASDNQSPLRREKHNSKKKTQQMSLMLFSLKIRKSIMSVTLRATADIGFIKTPNSKRK